MKSLARTKPPRRKSSPPVAPHSAVVKAPTVSVQQRKSKYGPWRAGVLIAVYMLMIVHVIHWKVAGRTVAPMEINEVMIALERGVITAGAILFLVLLLGTVIFGRFFCSWACHIMALQDLCSWILDKLRLRPKPMRSRLLAWVPAGAAAYMFIWPQVWRIIQGRAFPELTTRLTAGQDFWRNLPGPWVAILTFLVCGFATVYVMGARGFCNYVCPYGVLFGMLDRLTPGRIQVNEHCQQCAACTGICSSGVRVHEEVANYGMIVDPKCMKDLDCISVCPQNALHYGFTRPSLLKGSPAGKVRGRPYDFTLGEDLFMLAVLLLSFFALRGLYDTMPFLLSLATAAIVAYLALSSLRVYYRPDLRMAHYVLKVRGRTTPSGWAVAGLSATVVILVLHSALIQYHQRLGHYWFDQTIVPTASIHDQSLLDPRAVHRADVAIDNSLRHLQFCKRWGLLDPVRVNARLGWLWLLKNDAEQSEHFFREAMNKNPQQAIAHASLGMVLVRQGRHTEAASEYAQAAKLRPDYPQAQLSLATLLQMQGRFDEAIELCSAVTESHPDHAAAYNELGSAYMNHGFFDSAREAFENALRAKSDFVEAHYNLGVCLFRMGLTEQAVQHYQEALRLRPRDAQAHNNLGLALIRLERIDEAEACFHQALRLEANFAEPHLNLARAYASRSQLELADRHMREAVRINPQLAALLQMPDDPAR